MSAVGGNGIGEVGSQTVACLGAACNDIDDVGNVFSVAQTGIVNKMDMMNGFRVKTDDSVCEALAPLSWSWTEPRLFRAVIVCLISSILI